MGQIHKESTPAYLVIRRRTFKFPASYLCFESSKKGTTASGLDPTGVRRAGRNLRPCQRNDVLAMSFSAMHGGKFRDGACAGRSARGHASFK